MNHLYESTDIIKHPIECFEQNTDTGYFPVGPHWHYYTELIYVMEGKCRIILNNGEYLLNESEMIIIYPQTIHSFFAVDDKALKYAVIKINTNILDMSFHYFSNLKSILQIANEEGFSFVFDKETTESFGCREIFLNCMKEYNNQNYGYDLLVRAELYKVFIGVIRFWQNAGLSMKVVPPPESLDMFNVIAYIDRHLNEKIQVKEIAEKCGMSYPYFAKRFQEIYKKSCKDYIESMRVYKIEELLIFTEYDLNYITYELGFADCSHMIRIFKKHTGMTPRQFRLRYGKKHS